MRFLARLCVWLVILFWWQAAFAQPNRVPYNRQQLFLSGANLAWISFAKDIGPGFTDLNSLGDVMLQMHDHGGNALRWWLHTNGTVTPEFNDTGLVIGPGAGTIEDLKKALDIAWEREIGLKLCLWSFDMLRSSNSAAVKNRNRKLLTDTTYTRAYINKCLIPMVDSLKGHPAILAWEIFNEPEGMSDELGWSDIEHVPMTSIQRFINLCAGAIHRTDSTALVTNGAWSFKALTDVPEGVLTKIGAGFPQLSLAEKEQLATRFNEKYRLALTADQISAYLQRLARLANYNYYSDSRLVAAGGDLKGTLDFYSVHYYDWARTPLSPFHHLASAWGLDKPIVVAEFAIKDTYGAPKAYLYEILYQSGYSGGLAWSWTDVQFSTHDDMLASMQSMWNRHRADVDINGIGGDWPVVTITSPQDKAELPDTTKLTIEAEASDNDGSVVLVEFFVSDTIKIGEKSSPPYTATWTNITPGFYTLTAVATDNNGHKRTSNRVQVRVGAPLFVRLEAESAIRQGQNISVQSNPNASNGAYLEMRTQSGTITWQLHGVSAAGSFEIAFGYRLSFDTPKRQYINVNGVRVAEMVFDGAMYAWLEKKLLVNLVQGDNIIQMELSWGWMDLDYLAVPTKIVSSVGDQLAELPNSFQLEQNYPNPFNPVTTIKYSLAGREHVKLAIYDVLGRNVAILVDEEQNAGVYESRFDASTLASGVYIYRIEAGTFTQAKSMMLLK